MYKQAVVHGKCEEGLRKLREQYQQPFGPSAGQHHRVFRFSWGTAGEWGLRVNPPGTPQQQN